MPDDLRSRPTVPDDTETLFELHRAVFRAHIERIWGWNEEWQRARFREELEASSTSVVELMGRTIGYVQTDRSPERLYLRNIALHPDVQNQGIGTRLVRQVQQEAAQRGVPVELCVFRTNPRAREFYERLGFRQSGRTDSHIEMTWHPAPDADRQLPAE